MLRQPSTILPIRAGGHGLPEFTENARAFATQSGIRKGE
jgi:hypothetical protein